jgi:hypothetical protein
MYINRAEVEFDDAAIIGQCTYCGDPIDYCQGHGEIGDPVGFEALIAHDEGDHSMCHPEGCRYAPKPTHERIIMHAPRVYEPTPLQRLLGGYA